MRFPEIFIAAPSTYALATGGARVSKERERVCVTRRAR